MKFRKGIIVNFFFFMRWDIFRIYFLEMNGIKVKITSVVLEVVFV